MRQLLTSLGYASLLLAPVAGCGSAAEPPIDASFPDAVLPDAVIVHPVDDRADPCDAPMAVMGTLGTPSTVMLDTTMTETRPRDLGFACGNVTARVWARQEVIEYTVPGSGSVGVRVSTANMGTNTNFNTIVQIRRDCREIPTGIFTCFDNVSGTDPRTEAGFTAMGGDTVFIYVTGYSEPEAVSGQVDEGPVRVTIEAGPNTAPTLTTARYRISGMDAIIEGTGTDAESNVAGLSVFVYNAMGRINIGPNGIELRAPDAAGMMDWSARVTVPGSDIPLVEFCRRTDVNCTGAGIVAFDEYYASSAERRVMFETAAVVGFGDTCDMDNICAAGLVCGAMMTCEATPAAIAACMGATVIAVPAPTGMTTTASETTMLPATGRGTFTAPAGCVMMPTATDGQERIFRIDVPAGTYDLTIRTNLPATGMTDTVLYVRGDCGDPTDNLGCQDDVGMMELGSRVVVMNATEGDYYAILESYNGSGGAATIEASLRPVLDPGAACDPAGVQNRCAMGACPAATMMCP